MCATYEALLAHLDEQEVGYESFPEIGGVGFPIRTEGGIYFTRMFAEDDLIQVVTSAQLVVPQGSLRDVGETLHRANYGLKLGKFELDYGDGEIRFHISAAILSGILPGEIVDRLLSVALQMLDRYLPAVHCVVYANERPTDAISAVEAKPPEPPDEDQDENEIPG